MGNVVRIGRTVDYKKLETALIRAAEEVGWKASVKDEFERNYKLGSVHETHDYHHTMVHLRGRVFSAMKVFILNKNPTDTFFVWQGLPWGLASNSKVQEYLSAVSRNL